MSDLTKRQRFLAVMRRETTDGELVWVPNFDYWFKVNGLAGTLPEAYRNMNRDDIVRSIGATIWNRTYNVKKSYDPSIKHNYGKQANGTDYHEISTPIGSVFEEYSPTESKHSTRAHSRYFIQDHESLRIMTYIVEGTHLTVDFEDTIKALENTGEDGIVLNSGLCLPLIQYAKTDAGYMNAFYLMEDYPDDVDNLISIYHKKNVEVCKLLSSSPAEVIWLSDNMDELMISPKLFKKYGTGFYRECKDALGNEKILSVHWCGRTQHLLPLLHGTGIDLVEAIVTEPMAPITLEAALDILDSKVALQGGIPAIMVCPDVVSQRDFEHYVENVVLKQKGRPGFILGMSDNVPPNADFSRVEMISNII